jgi:hypothetical protein
MAFLVDTTTGEITLVQGDSGELVVEGLNTDKNYTIYFAFYNSKRKRLGSEVSVESNMSPNVTLVIPASLTDLLTVPQGEESAEYYYGIKACYDYGDGYKYEDTLVVGNNDIGDLNLITVYPKKVEGFTND